MSPFKIEYSLHATERLKERGITRQQIRLTLTHGRLAGIDLRGRKIKTLDFSKRKLEVVYIEDMSQIVVVTAYWKGLYP